MPNVTLGYERLFYCTILLELTENNRTEFLNGQKTNKVKNSLGSSRHTHSGPLTSVFSHFLIKILTIIGLLSGRKEVFLHYIFK